MSYSFTFDDLNFDKFDFCYFTFDDLHNFDFDDLQPQFWWLDDLNSNDFHFDLQLHFWWLKFW